MNPLEFRLANSVGLVLRHRLGLSLLDRETSGSLLRRLLALPTARRREAVESDQSFASPDLGQALLDRVESLFETDPREAAHLADLAATIGGRLAAPWTLLEGEALQGRARSLEGEAFRRWGRMADSRKAHGRAFRHLEALPAGCAERADFCRYLALLRRDQGRDEESLALMARALELFEGYPDRRRAQECRVALAWMHLDDLEAEVAMLLFNQTRMEEEVGRGWRSEGAGRATDRDGEVPRRDRELWLSARHGLALAYADLRRETDARALLAEIGEEVGGQPGFEPLRLKLIEASVLQRLDANEEAAELLFAAWSGYALQGEPHEAALALLELAQLRAEQGSIQDLARLKEGISTLAGLGENVREPILLGLDFATGHGLAAVERLEALKLFVQRARHDRQARFVLAQDLEGGGGEGGEE